MSFSKFKKEFKKAEKLIFKASEKVVRAVALQLFSVVIMRTPVGNPSLWKNDAPAGYSGGRLRANWQASLSTPVSGELDRIDSSGGSTINGVDSVLRNYTLDTKAFLTNNLPYANRVEDGYSSQRPTGMVKVSVREFKPLVDKLARKYKI